MTSARERDFVEAEKFALNLTGPLRARAASCLLRSLISILHDKDEGTAETLGREAELETNPKTAFAENARPNGTSHPRSVDLDMGGVRKSHRARPLSEVTDPTEPSQSAVLKRS